MIFMNTTPTLILGQPSPLFLGVQEALRLVIIGMVKLILVLAIMALLFLNDLWVFDPTNMSWTALAPCPCAARAHPALVAHNGKVFVGLGRSASGDMKDWWAYDISLNTWSQKGIYLH